jgi:hypothetical protein
MTTQQMIDRLRQMAQTRRSYGITGTAGLIDFDEVADRLEALSLTATYQPPRAADRQPIIPISLTGTLIP